MKKLFSICIVIALIMCSCAFASSLLEKSKDFYYNDAANVLEYEAKAEIYFNNKNLEKATGSQIVIATVRSTGSLTTDIYTDRLFNSWGVGDKKKDNGFLLLMVIARDPDDGDYWVSQGSGTNAMIDPGEIGDYLEKYLEPDFAKGKYSDGARKIFRVMFEHVRDYYGVNLAYQDYDAIERSGALGDQDSGFTAQKTAKKEGGGISWFWIILIIIVVIIIISSIRKKRRGTTVTRPVTTPVTPPIPPVPPVPPVSVTPAQPRRPRTVRTGYYHTPPAASRQTGFGLGSFLNGLGRGMSSSASSSRGSSPSRSYSSPSRSSSSGSSSSRPSSFGGAKGGGGRTSGGGAGRRR